MVNDSFCAIHSRAAHNDCDSVFDVSFSKSLENFEFKMNV